MTFPVPRLHQHIRRTPARKLFLLALLTTLTLGHFTSLARADDLDDSINDEMQNHNIHGVSLVIIQNNQIVSTRVYGSTDATGDNPIKPETLFQAGAASKAVSALGALLLVEQGKLTLDDDINKQLKDWKVPENEFTPNQKVTIRRILSNTSGLSGHGYAGYVRDKPVPTLTDILDGKEPANSPPIRVVTIPGTQWSYSSGGYTVLQKLMIDATGQPFPDLMSKLVFKPLQMDHSTYEQTLPAAWEQSAATGATPNGQELPGQWYLYPEMASNGLWTTPSDLARLVIALQLANTGHKDGVISPIIAQWMTTPIVRLKSEELLGDASMGLFLNGANDDIFGQDGGDAGFFASIRASAKDGVIIMINESQNLGSLYRMEEAAWNQYKLTPPWQTPNRTLDTTVDPKTYPDYVGRYEFDNAIQEITTKDGHLFAQLSGQGKAEIFPSGPDAFFYKVAKAGIVFERDKTGKVINAVLTQNGTIVRSPRLSEPPVLTPEILDTIVGQYQYAPQFILTITRKDNQLYAQATGQPKFALFPLSDHEFYWKAAPARIELVHGPDGKITGAIHHQSADAFNVPKLPSP